MKSEIKLLREDLAGSGGRVPDSSPGELRRKSRSSRGKGRASREGDLKVADQKPEQRRSLPKEPPEDAPVGPLVDYLNGRGVTVFEGSDDLNRNEAFEHLARHLGTHFELLSPFYEKMKRCVATGRGQRIDIDHFSDQERSAAVQFGTLLHRHGMLKDFYYHRSPKKQLRVIPTKDGQVGQFLTGGWLEIYVSLQLLRRLKAKYSPAKFQLLYNVKGTLPDGREFEADLMAAVEGQLFWLECKTGHWQDYAARFRGLVDIFGVDRASSALLLIRPPDQGTRQRATDMLNMTLLSLAEVDVFINGFLGIEGLDDEDDDGLMPLGTIPPLTDDEIPLENAEPARKLGRVNLGGGGADNDEDDDGDGDSAARRKRRRRGRRGGRGRSRSSEESGEAQESGSGGRERSSARSLLEAVPIVRDDDAPAPAAAKAAPEKFLPAGMIAGAPPAGANAAAGAAAAAEAEEAPAGSGDGDGDEESSDRPARKRSRGRRGGRGRRRGAQGDGDGESDADSADDDAADDDEPEVGEVAEAAAADEAPAEAGSADDDAAGKAPRRRRKRTRRSPFAVDEDAAEAAEAAEVVQVEEPEAAEAAEAAEAEEPEPVQAAAEPEQVEEPEPAVVAEAAPEPEPAPATKPQAKTSPRGTVIAPDLAAMMAGSTPPKPKQD